MPEIKIGYKPCGEEQSPQEFDMSRGDTLKE